jgi:hypothetical protein
MTTGGDFRRPPVGTPTWPLTIASRVRRVRWSSTVVATGVATRRGAWPHTARIRRAMIAAFVSWSAVTSTLATVRRCPPPWLLARLLAYHEWPELRLGLTPGAYELRPGHGQPHPFVYRWCPRRWLTHSDFGRVVKVNTTSRSVISMYMTRWSKVSPRCSRFRFCRPACSGLRSVGGCVSHPVRRRPGEAERAAARAASARTTVKVGLTWRPGWRPAPHEGGSTADGTARSVPEWERRMPRSAS